MPATQALALYIHIPFCVRKCEYCDFYSAPYELRAADAFVRAVSAEWELARSAYGLQESTVRTIYCGGGTPSVLAATQWDALQRGLFGALPVVDSLEWTVECNPESFTEEKARQWLDGGVSRLSLGVQSLDQEELELLGRSHTAGEALAVLDNPVLTRFCSVGADIMYGLPAQRPETLERTLAQILDRPVVNHLSAYELTLSDKSPMGRRRGSFAPVAEEESVRLHELIRGRCLGAGLEQYEISNYARAGHRSEHNQTYWRHEPYVGLGPGAHSYVDPVRSSNVADMGEYLDRVGRGELPVAFREELSRSQRVAEMVMLGLRTSEGICEERFLAKTGEYFRSGPRGAAVDQLVSEGLMVSSGSGYAPTPRGLLLADALAARLAWL